MKIGINGLGRMGRLTLRAGWDATELEFTHLNDPAGNAETFAHLLTFDSIHGQWQQSISATQSHLVIDGISIPLTANSAIDDSDWSDCDVVIEASGKFRSTESLQAYFRQGVKIVLVTAPVKEPSAQNIVMGVNQSILDLDNFQVITAASCTTNCLAPAVKVIHQALGIKHGSITTIHDITNTQTIIDAPHKDLRRARACGMSLIPTSTGSATAITEIFPELKGRLNGHAIRVPLTNASITDCVFEVERDTTVEEVNALLKSASEKELMGIMGFEQRPLVSIDYRTDPRSVIVDALSTMVVNNTQVKLYLWYDNEWGYANRTAELARLIVQKLTV